MSTTYYAGMPQILRYLDVILSWVALIAGAFGLTVLTGLIVVDVTLRYVFNSPIFGAQDISTLALIVIVAGSIPYAARTGMHVFVEILDKVLGKFGCRLADIIVRVIACGVVSTLTLLLIHGAKEVEEFAETTPLLELSFGPFYLALAVGFGFYALILAIEAIVLVFHPKIPRLNADTESKEES